MSNVTIVYHKDLDGYASCAIVAKILSAHNITMIPMQHGEPFPWNLVENRGMETIYIVDFILHSAGEDHLLADMERLAACCKNLIWIDHHVSANKDAYNYIGGKLKNCTYVYDENRAACDLTWEYLIDVIHPNWLDYIASADTWKNHGTFEWDNYIEPFVLRMQAEETDPKLSMYVWYLLFAADGHSTAVDFIEEGRIIMQYVKKRNKVYALRDAREIEFAGYRCIGINSNNHDSQVLDAVENPVTPYDIRILYSQKNNGKWYVSLYTTKDCVDCSIIAKENGGGGHKNAAGFECDVLPWS